MSGRFRTTNIKLPIHMDTIRPQKSSGWLVMTWGPGWMLWIVMAPIIRAVTALPGIPKVSSGMNDACEPELLAASGPATPEGWPLQKQIGRASGRERVCQYVSISVVAVALKKKKKY